MKIQTNDIIEPLHRREARRSGISSTRALPGGIATLLLVIAGCGAPDDPFNEVDRLRILGLRADPPSLAEGEVAELSALFHAPEGQAVTTRWSWCPFAASPSDGRQCLVSEEDLANMARSYIEQRSGEAAAQALPEVFPSFDLGDGPTAIFVHAIPAALLKELCTRLIADEMPSFTELPRCDDKLDVIIRLAVTSGNETVYGVKTLPLYVDANRADNENPSIDEVIVSPEGGAGGVEETDGVTFLQSRATYRLVANVPEDAADIFTPLPTDDQPNPIPRRESMFMTWYVTGGETEFVRTTFFDGEIPLDELEENFWLIPALNLLDSEDLTLYLVVQDERGGAGWISRRFTVEERLP